MDGNWNKWWVVPLYLLALPKILWNKLFPAPKAKNASRWDYSSMPVTPEEDEAWNELEKRQ